MKYRVLAPLVFVALFLISSWATPVATATSPGRDLFDFHVDKWMSLHHFAYHAARSLSRDEPPGLVALDPNDLQLLSREVATQFAPLAKAYAPYVRESILHSATTRSIAKDLKESPDHISDEKLKAELENFMPVYEAYFWPRHRKWATQFTGPLDIQLERYGKQMVSRLTSYLEQDWPDKPIRVDIVPYANWAGAYTDDNPPHITLASSDADISKHAFEMVFHEASHTSPLAHSIDLAAKQALHEAGLSSNRYWHYLLFYVSGRAASEILQDPGYVPYAKATGLASHPAAAPFYDALESVWDSENNLADRATAAAIHVSKLQTPSR
jgi:hypothetical protein